MNLHLNDHMQTRPKKGSQPSWKGNVGRKDQHVKDSPNWANGEDFSFRRIRKLIRAGE